MDPYKILGIERDATIEEIQRAYRTKALKHHPDRGGDDWAFHQVRQAYEELTQRAEATPAAESDATFHPARRRAPSRIDRTPPTANSSAEALSSPSWRQFLFGSLPLQTETNVFILVNVLDIFMTYVMLRFGGFEANPIARYFIDRWGFVGAIAFKLAIVALVCVLAQIIALYRLRTARLLLWSSTAIVSLVVLYGLYLFTKHVGS